MITRSTLATPLGRTPGQRRRFRRDLLIAWSHAQGFSQHYLADSFGLARSRVHQIITDVGEGWRDPQRFVDAFISPEPLERIPEWLATLRRRGSPSEN